MVDFIFFVLVFGAGSWLGQFGEFDRFVKEHSTAPYCIEKEIGATKIKKCYIAKEVE
jgi:hypothetical protein